MPSAAIRPRQLLSSDAYWLLWIVEQFVRCGSRRRHNLREILRRRRAGEGWSCVRAAFVTRRPIGRHWAAICEVCERDFWRSKVFDCSEPSSRAKPPLPPAAFVFRCQDAVCRRAVRPHGDCLAVLVGSQRRENVGDLAWFGAAAFQILAQLQLAVAMPFSAFLVASAVALEKDRKTLDLLLLTNLSNAELVLGKLLASMLSVVVVVIAALPLLAIFAFWAGFRPGQILAFKRLRWLAHLSPAAWARPSRYGAKRRFKPWR